MASRWALPAEVDAFRHFHGAIGSRGVALQTFLRVICPDLLAASLGTAERHASTRWNIRHFGEFAIGLIAAYLIDAVGPEFIRFIDSFQINGCAGFGLFR